MRQKKAGTLEDLHFVFSQAEQPRLELERLHEALAIWRVLSNRECHARILHSIGTAHVRLNEYELAFDAYHEAVKLYGELKDRSAQARALHSISQTHEFMAREAQDESGAKLEHVERARIW